MQHWFQNGTFSENRYARFGIEATAENLTKGPEIYPR